MNILEMCAELARLGDELKVEIAKRDCCNECKYYDGEYL